MPPRKTTSPRRVKLGDFKQQRIEAAGVELELDDGTVLVIPPPDLWPDDLFKSKTDEDYIRGIMGDQADAFVAGGGTARIINSLMIEKAHLSVPESGASSTS